MMLTIESPVSENERGDGGMKEMREMRETSGDKLCGEDDQHNAKFLKQKR